MYGFLPESFGANAAANDVKCTLDVTVTDGTGGSPVGSIDLENYLNQILSPANVGASINSGAPADYTLTDVSNSMARLLAPAVGRGVLGHTTTGPIGVPFNSGFIFSQKISAVVNAQGGSYVLAYDRIAAHELSHYLLHSGELPRPGQGVLSYGAGPGDPNTDRFLPTADQLKAIKQKCAELHPAGGQ